MSFSTRSGALARPAHGCAGIHDRPSRSPRVCSPTGQRDEERRRGGRTEKSERARVSRLHRSESRRRIAANTVRFVSGSLAGRGVPVPRRRGEKPVRGPARLRGRRAVPRPPRYRRPIGRPVLLAPGHVTDSVCARPLRLDGRERDSSNNRDTPRRTLERRRAAFASSLQRWIFIISPSVARYLSLSVSLQRRGGRSKFNHLLLAPRHEPTSLG